MEYKIFDPESYLSTEEYMKSLKIEGVTVKDLVGAVTSGNDMRYNFTLHVRFPEIREVIFDDPATIVYWTDNTKTVVKTHEEEFSKEHGLAMAIARKYFQGNRTQFLETVENATVRNSTVRKAEKAKMKLLKERGVKKTVRKAKFVHIGDE